MSHKHYPGVDYRAKCSASGSPQLGNCNTWPVTSGSGVFPLYENLTRVDDYTDVSPTGIPPYSRPRDTRELPSCAGGIICDYGLDPGNPLCGEWDITGEPGNLIFACNGGDASIGKNCYHKTSGFLDYRNCNPRVGFKNVQAQKNWQGRFGFTSHDSVPAFSFLRSGCGGCSYEPPQPTADQTKYLTIHYNGTYSSVGDDPHNYSASIDKQQSVGRYNGIVTLDGCSTGASGPTEDGKGAFLAIASNALGLGASSQQSCAGLYFEQLVLYSVDESEETISALARSFSISRGSATISSSFDFNAGTYSLSYSAPGNSYTETLSVGSTSVNYDFVNDYISSVYTFHDERHYSAALSNPYTASEVISDLTGLLAHWPLSDDVIYPWRTDQFATIAPVISYNESFASPDTSVPCDGSWRDPAALTYDGSIKGAPLPKGYYGFFDWKHVIWDSCFDPDAGTTAYYKAKFGESSTDGPIPVSATQWTENFFAGNLRPWAWSLYDGSTLKAQKWAEIKIPRPSFNFARPCGADRFSTVEDTVRCITANDMGTPATITIDDTINGDPGIQTSDSVLVCGAGSGQDGGWTVTRLDEQNYQLTTKLFGFPSGYNSPVDCEAGIIGRLRFVSVPGICGKVQVVHATNQNPIVLALTEDTYLRDGDQVIVEGVQGNTAANGVWRVGVRAADSIVLSGSNGNADYLAGGFVSQIGAADEKWNDTQSKGDFTTQTWEYSFRDYGEQVRLSGQYYNFCSGSDGLCPDIPAPPAPVRPNCALGSVVSNFTCNQGCIGYKNCSVPVIYFSPNNEGFSNGVNYGFKFSIDERYTTLWQGQVTQWNIDPLWQRPHKPCVNLDLTDEDGTHPQDVQWREDGPIAYCAQDTFDPDTLRPIKYYPQKPWVEGRCDYPDGAPLLPKSIPFGCMTYAQLNQVPLPSGINVCAPPGIMGHAPGSANPNTQVMSHTIWLGELDCVCSNARPEFVAVYQEDGVNCATSPPP
jgi:hypothetical protein